MYQGCRSATKDQHYKDQFEALANDSTTKSDSQNASEHSTKPQVKLTYRVMCSQDGPPRGQRLYVQDLILQDAKRIWELVGPRQAFVYISGYVIVGGASAAAVMTHRFALRSCAYPFCRL